MNGIVPRTWVDVNKIKMYANTSWSSMSNPNNHVTPNKGSKAATLFSPFLWFELKWLNKMIYNKNYFFFANMKSHCTVAITVLNQPLLRASTQFKQQMVIACGKFSCSHLAHTRGWINLQKRLLYIPPGFHHLVIAVFSGHFSKHNFKQYNEEN